MPEVPHDGEAGLDGGFLRADMDGLGVISAGVEACSCFMAFFNKVLKPMEKIPIDGLGVAQVAVNGMNRQVRDGALHGLNGCDLRFEEGLGELRVSDFVDGFVDLVLG